MGLRQGQFLIKTGLGQSDIANPTLKVKLSTPQAHRLTIKHYSVVQTDLDGN